jgi:hypothetical protein
MGSPASRLKLTNVNLWLENLGRHVLSIEIWKKVKNT